MPTVNELADELIELILDTVPVAGTLLGLRGRDDRLADYSETADEALRANVQDLAARARAVDPGSLVDVDRVTRSVILEEAQAVFARLDSRFVEYTLTDNFTAPVAGLLFELPMIVISDEAQADAYLTRLSRIPALLSTVASRHRAGVAAGRLPVRHLADAAVAHLDRYLADPASDPLLRPAAPSGDGRFEDARVRLLEQTVRPAFAAYRDAVRADIAPHGRDEAHAGLCWMADGDALYARLAQVHTTTTRTPDELHQTGLDIIARLADEYSEVGAEVYGSRDATKILARQRTDTSLRWRDGDELLDSARAAIRRAETEAPNWFGRLPSSNCQVAAVPAAEAPGASAAYYFPPAIDGSRAGTYFANTYRADERDRHASEAMAYHEAVPGHHFQVTIALELTNLPLLRRLPLFNAYSEGWGLYSERLADEMGLYSDAVARLGMLNLDSMRAARLVVDTGLHAKGWSRQQAVDYMLDNTAMPKVEIDSEVDRYIADPGQALAYMVGRLEIQRLRARSEAALGERFDIRSFHDTVLSSGALPLSVLDAVIEGWAVQQSG